ncbi:Adenylyltransferase and sulfurtransferase MOCS3-like protein [Meloidogyne graminicola]|uniref:Adenylyltransferase and sulfurtransferase MOCS3-like protein n=1 Tax=Meloidogyne graminicola TaxID=189291 RepID=A0A8S9ZVM0_9BILA|nr:Adenylyltransferase and sulfurtransferase MOCS3-like protein [Meloidogyne graminicola]
MVSPHTHSLSKEDIARFSRQLMLKGIGPAGQERLRDIRVLIIGAGGLGCPVALYLAAAGVGKIGIVDHDTVSIDNLHRQIAHNETRLNEPKVESLKKALLNINSKVLVIALNLLLTSKNSQQIFCDYDIVADCSDNVATRYLINDACVLTGKPLVSGSALGWEGQLTVYNNGQKCPCYRCIFPEPPSPEMVTSCSEGGVLGPVVGVIGSLQALEIIKISVLGKSSFAGNLWLFDGFDGKTKMISLREKIAGCAICSENPKITELQDYEKFCGSGPTDKVRSLDILPKNQRITTMEYSKLRHTKEGIILLDVRPRSEFEICHLHEAINIPLDDLKKWSIETIIEQFNDEKERRQGNGEGIDGKYLIK